MKMQNLKSEAQSKLNDKQQMFCEYYAMTCNATKSAVEAGYSEKTATAIASRLLRNVNAQQYIKELSEKIKSARVADIQEVKEFWTKIIRSKDAKMMDKLKASEYLAKSSGAFTEKVEMKSSVTVNNPFESLTIEELKALAKKKR